MQFDSWEKIELWGQMVILFSFFKYLWELVKPEVLACYEFFEKVLFQETWELLLLH